MARAKKLESITRQLGQVIPLLSGDSSRVLEPALGESFELYTLPFSFLASWSESSIILDYAQRTGAWLHLIKSDSEAIAVAQSSAHGPALSEWSIQNLFSSPFASKLARSIDHLDSVRSDDAIEAVLLFVPSFHIQVFLLVEERRAEVYIIGVPVNFNTIREGEFYTEQSFVQSLRSAADAGRLSISG